MPPGHLAMALAEKGLGMSAVSSHAMARSTTLHGLRGALAFALLLYHVANSGLSRHEGVFWDAIDHVLRSFEHGVELFFCISGVVIVQYRTENARIIPVFGAVAVEVSPRVGHLHVTVDERPGTWAHTSGDPIIVMGLPPGPHTMRIELADPNHRILASETLAVTVPAQSTPDAHAH